MLLSSFINDILIKFNCLNSFWCSKI